MKLAFCMALATGLFWGCYGPALALSRASLGSPFKPYVAIGVAYLVWAIVGGLIGMKWRGESFSLSGPGALWGFIAGTLGAWGALGLTSAMASGGGKIPHVIMAMVFGGAVTIAGLIGWWQSRSTAHPTLWAGMILIITGVIIVAYFTPTAHASPTQRQTSVTSIAAPRT